MLPSRRAMPPRPEELPARPKVPRPSRGAAATPLGRALDLGDLDERIRQAEQRLIARQQVLGRRVGALGLRLRRALQPQRLAGPLLGGAAALLAVGWWVGRHTGGRARGGPASGGPPPGPLQPAADPWWARLIALAWPLLPRDWREQAGPAAALAVGLGLAVRRRQPPA